MKYGVYRLDIYTRPGWFLINSYDNVSDAILYCDMLNKDTEIPHMVFEMDEHG
jgi:hypothetical protein